MRVEHRAPCDLIYPNGLESSDELERVVSIGVREFAGGATGDETDRGGEMGFLCLGARSIVEM